MASPNFIGVPGLPGTNTNPIVTEGSIGGNPVNLTQLGGGSIDDPLQGADAIARDLNGLFGSDLSSTDIPALIGGTPEQTGSKGASSPGLASTISDLFLRAVIIILGFIFVAVGISMFKDTRVNINIDPLKGVKKSLKG